MGLGEKNVEDVMGAGIPTTEDTISRRKTQRPAAAWYRG
jgi:hypothetical protein